MKPIRTERLILRNWEERDRDLFHRINSDERVMEFFPFRRDRAQADAVMDRMRAWHRRGRLWLRRRRDCRDAANASASSGCIDTDDRAVAARRHDRDRLAAGAGISGATAMSRKRPRRCSPSASRRSAWSEIISFAVWNNRRSTAVMERLGMRARSRDDFDHPHVPDTHPHLKRHVLYRLTREDWRAGK